MNIFNIINKKDKNLNAKYIEECFNDLISGEDKEKVFQSIRKTLNIITEDHCEDIYIGKPTKEVYGMSVYLSQSNIQNIMPMIIDPKHDSKDVTKAILSKKLSYVIEIDPNITNPVYKFNTSELTAILLHEIGHVTADTDFYNELKQAYQRALFQLSDQDIIDTKINSVGVNLGILYTLSAIQQTHISKYKGTIENEQIADKFVVEMGYGRELQSAIDKFKKIYLSNYVKKDIEDILDTEAQTFIHLNHSFKLRKRYVTDLIKTEEKLSKSKTISDALKDVYNKLNKVLIRESNITIGDRILDESFLDLFSRNPIKVSQSDIDQLKIELEMMEDFDDKSVVVYKIHKRMTQLANCKDRLNKNSRDYKYNCQCIEGYEKQLQKMLESALKFKVVEKTYGVLVKYPKGYEG